VLIIMAVIVAVNRSLNALRDIITQIEKYRDKPIQSYIQVGKILSVGVLIILILSILTNRTPLFFLTSLGAMAAIIVLIFKDTILGFIGSIQLAANDIIRIGDWVTMEKYGADGDVEEISLSTVKVRNFDRTITTIPTYAFISDSFKNWRGMEESDGRRIKRSILIEVDTVHFASSELLGKLQQVSILKDFVIQRQKEIQEFNKKHGFDAESGINGRKQTNLGLFRRYVQYYLNHNTMVNQEMTLMVRQLASSAFGIPLEVYCFSKTKVWEEYEDLQADIFDHLFSVIRMFELEVYERPSGRDFKS
jgi:miniconductance mechanosensitive channel